MSTWHTTGAPTGDWRTSGLCAQTDSEVFFETIARAKKICHGCPVQAQCREFVLAMSDPPKYGIWAGMSPHQIRALRRAHKQAA